MVVHVSPTMRVGRIAYFSFLIFYTSFTLADELRKPCPRSCKSHPDQAEWNSYFSLDRFEVCEEPLLLTFATYSALDDPSNQIKIRTCTAGDAESDTNALTGTSINAFDYSANITDEDHPDSARIAKRASLEDDDLDSTPTCYNASTSQSMAGVLSWTSNVQYDGKLVSTSLTNLGNFLKNPINCDEKVIYGYNQGTLVGAYIGARIQNKGVGTDFIQSVSSTLKSKQGRAVVQVNCGKASSDKTIGVVIDPNGDFAWVQKIVRSWSEGKCVSEAASTDAASPQQLQVNVPINIDSYNSTQGVLSFRLRSKRQASSPTPRPDGTCASYIIVNDDSCSKIQTKYGLTKQQIYDYNKQTYGWGGCDTIHPGDRICVSSGIPRLPAPNSDASCGPRKPGTVSPTDGTKVEDLNPCPIKACCNIWGNCGVDIDFCVPSKSETGNPGTAAPNTNGCVQNCGMELVNNNVAPDFFMKVAYFEGWNQDRPCLHMSPGDIPPSFTHVHWAFANIDTSFQINVGRYTDMFDQFKALSVKRIVSFGGWAFSTEPATYQIFRNAVKSANRETFASAVVSFVQQHNLDGADFDWEYPAEPDIPGIPAGDASESKDYLEFMKLMKSKMPSGKTVSFAAPASFWYLKQFLLAEMAAVSDYIIYMTYDLHGQWDYANAWSQPGCKAGNCLRSHVNMTETMSSLVMITKAGVPSNKVVVGVTSYGRSFKMVDPSCSGPMCAYTGPESGAEHGRCTDTGGYISNGELDDIISSGRVSKQWIDDTQSNYVIYDGNWVAYMDEPNKQSRIAKYKSLNFRGTTDWAVDLAANAASGSGDVVYLGPAVWTGTPARCIPPCIFVLPPSRLPSATTISIPPYTTSIEFVSKTTITITVQVSSIVTSVIDFSNIRIPTGQNTGTFRPGISIDIPPYVTTITGPGGLIQTRTLLLPPWPAITDGPPSQWSSTKNSWQFPQGTSMEPDPGPVPTMPRTSKPPFTWPLINTDPTSTFPDTFTLFPVETDVPDNGEDDDGNGQHHKTTCKLWFFFVCVKWDDWNIRIGGWDWVLPPGRYGPGPPPIHIQFPPGWTLHGTLPWWPAITVPVGGKPAFDPKPSDCKPAQASICKTTSSFATTVNGGVTRTTATQVKSTCATITGCNIKDYEATKTVEACTLKNIRLRDALQTEAPSELGAMLESPLRQRSVLDKRAEPNWECESNGPDGIIWPAAYGDSDQVQIRAILARRETALKNRNMKGSYREVRANDLDFTAFYWVENMGQLATAYFNSDQITQISRAYDWKAEASSETNIEDLSRILVPKDPKSSLNRLHKHSNNASTLYDRSESSKLYKRVVTPEVSEKWHLSHISWPDDQGLLFSRDSPPHRPSQKKYIYNYDTTLGAGQTIYIVEGGYAEHSEFASVPKRVLGPAKYGDTTVSFDDGSKFHSAIVTLFAVGKTYGVARNVAEFVHVSSPPSLGGTRWPKEAIVESFITIANDHAGKEKAALSSVVNCSFGVKKNLLPEGIQVIWNNLLSRMEEKYGIVFVASAGNQRGDVEEYPALFQSSLAGMLVVGATDLRGNRWYDSADDENVVVWAPGVVVPYPSDMKSWPGVPAKYQDGSVSGTSISAALTSGLVAYYRAHPRLGRAPLLVTNNRVRLRTLRSQIRSMSRSINYDSANLSGDAPSIIWNGEDFRDTCAAGSNSKRGLVIRQDGGSCPLQPGATQGRPVTFTSGPAAPLCTANCGHLCKGYYCSGLPSGTPPDFTSPPIPTSPSTFTGLPGLPNLPTDATPTGLSCASTATKTECNGGVRGGVCVTSTKCEIWQLTGLPTLTSFTPPSGYTCKSSSTWTFTGGPGGGRGAATITSSGCALWASPTPTPTPTPQPTPTPARKPEGWFEIWTSSLDIPAAFGDSILSFDLSTYSIVDVKKFDPCETLANFQMGTSSLGLVSPLKDLDIFGAKCTFTVTDWSNAQIGPKKGAKVGKLECNVYDTVDCYVGQTQAFQNCKSSSPFPYVLTLYQAAVCKW